MKVHRESHEVILPAGIGAQRGIPFYLTINHFTSFISLFTAPDAIFCEIFKSGFERDVGECFSPGYLTVVCTGRSKIVRHFDD